MPDLSPFASKIVEVNRNFDALQGWFQEKGTPISRLELLYRGSEHGFSAEEFHKRCDDSIPTTTLTFDLSEMGKAFGGFASVPWSSAHSLDYPDHTAFIFSLTNRTKHEQYQLKEKAIRHYPTYMPTFGWAHDIYICDKCDKEPNSHSYFGHSENGTFLLPEHLEKDSEEAFSYLAGAKNFLVREIEVFKVHF